MKVLLEACILIAAATIVGCGKHEQVGEARFVGLFREVDVRPGGFTSATRTIVRTDAAQFVLGGQIVREATFADSCFVVTLDRRFEQRGEWLVMGDTRYLLRWL